MAECALFVCDHCDESIQAWSDGNPYFIDEDGKKRYAYHPDHVNLDRCVGNDEPYLCLACGKSFKEDSRKPWGHCPRCKDERISDVFELDGKPCPFCEEGTFRRDPDFFAVS